MTDRLRQRRAGRLHGPDVAAERWWSPGGQPPIPREPPRAGSAHLARRPLGAHAPRRGGQDLSSSRALTDLSALSGLTAIGGKLELQGPEALPSLAGLEALRAIGGDLHLSDADALTSLEPLFEVASVAEDVSIRNNPGFSNADALVRAIGEENIGGEIDVYGSGE